MIERVRNIFFFFIKSVDKNNITHDCNGRASDNVTSSIRKGGVPPGNSHDDLREWQVFEKV